MIHPFGLTKIKKIKYLGSDYLISYIIIIKKETSVCIGKKEAYIFHVLFDV